MHLDPGPEQRAIVDVDPRLTVGPPLIVEDLPRLVLHGYKGVINLRLTEERDAPMSPYEEGQRVRALGLVYEHVPIDPRLPEPEDVDRFRDALARIPGAVYVHCRTGKRSGALACLHVGIDDGLDAHGVLAKALSLGFRVDRPQYRALIEGYVSGHTGVPAL